MAEQHCQAMVAAEFSRVVEGVLPLPVTHELEALIEFVGSISKESAVEWLGHVAVVSSIIINTCQCAECEILHQLYFCEGITEETEILCWIFWIVNQLTERVVHVAHSVYRTTPATIVVIDRSERMRTEHIPHHSRSIAFAAYCLIVLVGIADWKVFSYAQTIVEEVVFAVCTNWESLHEGFFHDTFVVVIANWEHRASVLIAIRECEVVTLDKRHAWHFIIPVGIACCLVIWWECVLVNTNWRKNRRRIVVVPSIIVETLRGVWVAAVVHPRLPYCTA